MEESVGSTIDKIKLQELSTEAKLKEKRELELTIATLNKNIRETLTFIEKSKKNQVELARKNDKLHSQMELIKLKRDALLSQIELYKKELADLIHKADNDISNVWMLRSSMVSAIHDVTDKYDIFALLAKPIAASPLPVVLQSPIEVDSEIEIKLKEAIKRKETALAEKDRLLNEPDTGAEFIRIQNALKYSLEKIASLRKT